MYIFTVIPGEILFLLLIWIIYSLHFLKFSFYSTSTDQLFFVERLTWSNIHLYITVSGMPTRNDKEKGIKADPSAALKVPDINTIGLDWSNKLFIILKQSHFDLGSEK